VGNNPPKPFKKFLTLTERVRGNNVKGTSKNQLKAAKV
jgi:hypothetical protein